MEKATHINPALQQLTQEHDQVLELCSRIRIGLNNKIQTHRIRNYVDWFKTNYLIPHFEIEKQHIFPLLGMNYRVKRALANHRRINRLLSCSCEDIIVLNLLEEELATFIRFEERTLYNSIRTQFQPNTLLKIENRLGAIAFDDNHWKDPFWQD
jgi:hypothetical protein